MKEKPTPQHKRLAMGDTIKGYARGGVIGTPRGIFTGMGANPLGGAGRGSPLVAARRSNGVRGMKRGGSSNSDT